MRARAVLAALATAAAILLLVLPAGAAAKPNPFFGLNSWKIPTLKELQRMSAGGAGYYRTNFLWDMVLPTSAATPDYHVYDALMLNASQAGINVLPDLVGNFRPKGAAGMANWLAFVRMTVDRYKPGGQFWIDHPELVTKARTIHSWQVWNEPNLSAYWPSEKASEYGAFFVQTAKVIKQADPQAEVVVAGIPQSAYGVPQKKYIAGLYRVPGFKQAANVIAAHGYSKDYTGAIANVKRVRSVMNANGDTKKPIWVTEIGWATGGEKRPWVTTPKNQAKQLRLTAQALLARQTSLHIRGMVWFSWRDTGEPKHWGTHTGLFWAKGYPKPAWGAFAKVAGGTPGTGRI